MKAPIKAIKKIIKYCEKRDFLCSDCEIKDICDECFCGVPQTRWKTLLSNVKGFEEYKED